MKKLITIIAIALTFGSCATKFNKEIKENQSVLNGIWELSSSSFSSNLSKDFGNGLPTVNFEYTDNLKVFGYDGCNHFNGSAEVKKNNSITFSDNFASTMMACSNVKDYDYTKLLTSSTTYELVNNDVLILKSTGGELKFHRVTLNGNWYLDKIYVGKIKAA